MSTPWVMPLIHSPPVSCITLYTLHQKIISLVVFFKVTCAVTHKQGVPVASAVILYITCYIYAKKVQYMYKSNQANQKCIRECTYLICNRSNILERKRLKLILFEKIIQILFQHFKNKTCMIFVLKAFICPNKIVVISIFLSKPGQDANLKKTW